MKKTILFLLSFIFLVSSKGQITKGNWMLGGTFSYLKSKSSGTDAFNRKLREMEILPAVGYFVFNKCALGVKSKLLFGKEKTVQPNGIETANIQNNLGIGPFARYYFLPTENMVNVYVDGSAFYKETTINSIGDRLAKYKAFDYSFMGGCVLFLNTSVGIEFSLGYFNTRSINLDEDAEDLKFGIGLQIHLEK